MDRRHAPEHGGTEVERRPVEPRRLRPDRRRHVADVGDEPQPAREVERPRLGRDVARGVAEAEERLEVVAPLLGDDLTLVLLVEPVEHHPVEAGDAADLGARERRQLLQRRSRLQPLQDAPHPVERRGHRLGLGLARLHLEHEQPAAAVDDPVPRLAVHAEREGVHALEVVAERPRLPPVDEVADVGAERLDTEHLPRVRRRPHDVVLVVEREQHPLRLDGAGDVDRLPRALDEVGVDVAHAVARARNASNVACAAAAISSGSCRPAAARNDAQRAGAASP